MSTSTVTTASSPPAVPAGPSLNIVILDRGFVLVGEVEIVGDWVVTTDARTIRRWGTTKGIGEIAMGGPTPNTKLEDLGTVRSPLHALIGLVACEPAPWKR